MYPASISGSTRTCRPPRRDPALVLEDIYLVLAAFEPGEQSATVELVVNPLNWLWPASAAPGQAR